MISFLNRQQQPVLSETIDEPKNSDRVVKHRKQTPFDRYMLKCAHDYFNITNALGVAHRFVEMTKSDRVIYGRTMLFASTSPPEISNKLNIDGKKNES